jgi:hypothetical protein
MHVSVISVDMCMIAVRVIMLVNQCVPHIEA